MMSSLILSQSTNTNQSRIPNINNIYQGLKQNDFLRELNRKNTEALEKADKLIKEEKAANAKLKAALEKSEQINESERKSYDLREQVLKNDLDTQMQINGVLKAENAAIGRKKWGQGFLIGGVTVAVVGTITVLYLTTR